jgi:hypothetical protein
MIAFVRYTVGLGNAALYARIRNEIGEFWDFVGLEWVTPITADCKQFLTEYADSDPATSYFSKEIFVPFNGVFCIEIVVDSTSLVIGYESTRDAGADVPETGLVVADASNSIISFKTDLPSTTDNYCSGSFVKFITGALINQVKKIASPGYGGTSKLMLVTAGFTEIPTAGDRFIIINQ